MRPPMKRVTPMPDFSAPKVYQFGLSKVLKGTGLLSPRFTA